MVFLHEENEWCPKEDFPENQLRGAPEGCSGAKKYADRVFVVGLN